MVEGSGVQICPNPVPESRIRLFGSLITAVKPFTIDDSRQFLLTADGFCKRSLKGSTIMRTFESWHQVDPSDRGLLLRCRDEVRKAVSDATVVLFGSRSRGEGGKNSDFDLLVLVDGEPDLALEDEIRKALFPIELETGAVLTLLVYSREDWESSLYQAMPLVQNIEREGVIL